MIIEVEGTDITTEAEVNVMIRTYAPPTTERRIIVEFWNREEALDYFDGLKPTFVNPLNGNEHPSRGFIDVMIDDETGEEFYGICIINDVEDWKQVLIHELVHLKQCEKMGVTIWRQLGDIYENDRMNDPLEIEAYFAEIVFLQNDVLTNVGAYVHDEMWSNWWKHQHRTEADYQATYFINEMAYAERHRNAIDNTIRWKTQANTPFKELSPEDQEKDLKFAREIRNILLGSAWK
jgi:hypothetical protein